MIYQQSALNTLAGMLPVKTCRVSSAKARGEAKKYAYWGAVRYQIQMNREGELTNLPKGRASSDRRSFRLAQQDAEELCIREQRVMCQRIGIITEEDAAEILSYMEIYSIPERILAAGSNQ